MKYIVIVPDGMADEPLEELGRKTPLEVARKTNMDYMAQNGRIGMVQTIPDKMSPGSDIGNLSVLGYDPKKCFSGRAALEAANQLIDLAEDEIVFRCNLVTVEGHNMYDYSAGHISSAEAKTLIEELNKKMGEKTIRFYPGKSYRHLLVLKVRNVSEYFNTKCAPPHDIMGKNIKNHLPKGGPEALMLLRLMEQSRSILESHEINKVKIDLGENPANMIWLWGQGVKPNIPSFEEKYGVKGAIISAVDLVNGIGRLAGLNVIEVPGITGYYDTNYQGKAEYALNALKSNDFVFIHIEAPDEAGHNGDYKAKIEAIKHIDKKIIGTILNHFDKQEDVRILVVPDHPTPIRLRTHTRDPVGFVMYGKRIEPNGAIIFNEKTAKEKGLTFHSGEEMMDDFITKYLA